MTSSRPGRRRSLASGVLAVLAVVLAAAQGASAQPATPEPPPSEGAVDAPQAGASGDAAASDPGTQLAELEAQRARLAATAASWREKTAAFLKQRDGASTTLQQLDREIRELNAAAPQPIADDAALFELEAELVGAEQDLSLAREQSLALEAEQAGRPERRRQLPDVLIAAKQRLLELGDDDLAVAGAPAPLRGAMQAVARARRESVEAEIASYEAELKSFEVRGQLLAKRLDRSAARIAHHESRVARLRAAVKARRAAAAVDDATHVRASLDEVETLPEAVRAYALELVHQNAQLAEARDGPDGLASRIDDLRAKLARADERVTQVEADFERLTRKIEAAGLSDSVGLSLRKQRSEAPDVGKYDRFIRMRQDEIGAVQIELIERREDRRALSNVDAVLARAMEELGASIPPDDRAAAESLLRSLLETKRDYLDLLIADYETYFQGLVDFDARQQQLIDKTARLLQFIDERVLWIPSGGTLYPAKIVDGVDGLRWLLSPRFAGQLWRSLREIAADAPLPTVAVVLLAAAYAAGRRRVVARIAELGRVASASTCDRMGPTWLVLGFGLLLALWLPALLYFVGWRLSEAETATQYVRCVAFGATSAAVLWGSLAVPRQMFRPGGLFESHLETPADASASMWRDLRWLIAVAVPVVFLVQVFEMRAEDAWRESIGRVAFVVLLASVSVLAHLVMREGRGAMWQITQSRSELSVRPVVWRLAHGMLVGAGLLLIVATIRGYYWTALQLTTELYLTLLFLVLLLATLLLLLRWSLLARRHVAFARIAAERAHAAEGQDDDEPREPDLDLGMADAHAARLLKSAAFVALLLGLWLIWSDLLPATGMLRRVELWDATKNVTVEVTNAAGETTFVEQEHVAPVTLADLLLALLIGVLTFALARNLPGVLEITLLQRLGAGERYAYTTITKYLATALGVVIAFNAIGVGWSSIQWLVAAVGLGLGFGLQEIFANFVSGLIILFERPIRVGDTVTVGDISGVVSKVRIRATWITGFDRKELIVPNKEFVTTRLVNWSLTDPITRVEIPVGIAYGSDTDKAIEVLLRVARENPDVMENPKPDALFLGFGDSALDFQLRVFSPHVDRRLAIVHQLHLAIDRAFRAEGIEIAFPQRDVHLKGFPLPAPPPGETGA